VGDAVGDRAGLAGAGAGEDADRAAQRLGRLTLLRVETRQHVRGHWNIVAGAGVDPTVPTATPQALTIYSTPWCGYCTRLKHALEREGVDFVDVDIEQDPAAADFVISVNGGHATVPTVVLPDGTALVNPAVGELLAALRAA
jgi:mycoredoxin